MMETKVVIDTSTLMSLYEYCAQNLNGDRGYGLLDLDVQDRLLYVAEGAIESLIFYDHPLFDNNQFQNRRWQNFLHDLDLVEGNSLLSISPQAEESLYKKVLPVQTAILECITPELFSKGRLLANKCLKMYMELHDNPPFPAWKDGLDEVWN